MLPHSIHWRVSYKEDIKKANAAIVFVATIAQQPQHNTKTQHFRFRGACRKMQFRPTELVSSSVINA
jgi:hypothetical protein